MTDKKYQCPNCKGKIIDQYRSPFGPMWCVECGFMVEDKNVKDNPFIIKNNKNRETFTK